MKQNTFQGVLLVLIFGALVYISIQLGSRPVSPSPLPPGDARGDTTASTGSGDKKTGPKVYSLTLAASGSSSEKGAPQAKLFLPLTVSDSTKKGGTGPKFYFTVTVKEESSVGKDPDK